jgi:protein-S-isoprenylcysteine O-methyltransferase Ste14
VVIGGFMWLVAWAAPQFRADFSGRIPFALALVAAGALAVLAGGAAFRQAQTTVNPMTPEASSSVVTTGVYRWSRNPMYLGFLFVLAGWGVYLGSAAALLFLPAFVLYMNRFQIAPEERALQAKFGASYTGYMRRVRRWL